MLALFALLIANCIPLAGVIFWEWNLYYVMLLYWAENVAVGLWTAARIASLGRPLMIPFFSLHYGLFMFAHLMAVTQLFGQAEPFVQTLQELRYPILALILSHGVSFYYHFLETGRFETAKLGDEMGRPYKRMAILHITIIFGGLLVDVLGAPLAALMLLIILKTFFDGYLSKSTH